jgi:hypothetical protein
MKKKEKMKLYINEKYGPTTIDIIDKKHKNK